MRRNLALYRRLVGILIRSQVHYRIPFFFDLMGTALITTIGFGSLAMIFGRFGSIAGWSLGEVAFLYGIAETSFGLMDMLFSGFDPPNFGRQVRLGLFDQLLLRPVNITLQIMGSDFVLRRIGRILQGMVIFGLAVHMTHVHWTLGKLLYLPLVFASVIAFFGGLFITGATITFWTVESIEIINILTYGGTEMMSYPMHIYQDWLRYFFTYILPAVFLSYYPALYMLDKPDPFHFPAFAPFLSPIVGFGLLGLALAFWNFGIRHYQSTGT